MILRNLENVLSVKFHAAAFSANPLLLVWHCATSKGADQCQKIVWLLFNFSNCRLMITNTTVQPTAEFAKKLKF